MQHQQVFELDFFTDDFLTSHMQDSSASSSTSSSTNTTPVHTTLNSITTPTPTSYADHDPWLFNADLLLNEELQAEAVKMNHTSPALSK